MKYFIIFIIFISTGCATNRAKQIITTSIATSVFGTIGAIRSPKDESTMAHFLMWGGTAGTITAIGSKYIFDYEKNILQKENEIRSLRLDIEEQTKKSLPSLEQISVDPIYKSIPKTINHMIKPGSWKLYKLDNWVEDGDNQLIHQDKLIEIIPSQLIPNSALKQTTEGN